VTPAATAGAGQTRSADVGAADVGAADVGAAGVGAADAGGADGQAAAYAVRDAGVRCIAAPCPSYSAVREGAPAGTEPLPVHELDLAPLGLGEEQQAALLERMTRESVRMEATVSVRPKAGPAGDATVLRVLRQLP
jgi:hypothetical protein